MDKVLACESKKNEGVEEKGLLFKFYDKQTGDYSAHNTLEGLFSMLCEGFCECGEDDDYEQLDDKDGQMKCKNCWRLNNLEKVTAQEMRNYIEEHEYVIENKTDCE